MDYIREHKRGIIGTAIFHIIVLILLFILGFFTPLPLPGEEGILVNFGTSENGFGNVEPSPKKSTPVPVQQQEKEVPPPPPKSTPTPQQPKPAAAEEVAMTQDYEETAAIDAAEEKKKIEEQKHKDELEKQRQQELEAERIRKAEEERIRKAEAEKLAREEAERKAREEEERKINEMNALAQGAFANSNEGTGGKGTGQSQGATYPGGNQGAPTGDENSSDYGPGGSGNGTQGSGISFSLSGRSASSLPKPKYPGDDAGTVVVKVTVDKFGTVTAAEAGARGTTIMNKRFWEEARQAALKAKFNADSDAPAYQQGTISYRFVLD